MNSQKIKIAFFSNMFDSNSKRGAMRLFTAIIHELSRCEDIELYGLFERLPSEFNPVSSIFKVRRFKNSKMVEIEQEINSLDDTQKLNLYNNPFKTRYINVREKYRSSVSKPIRNLLRPFSFIIIKILKIVYHRIRPLVFEYKERGLRGGYPNIFSRNFIKEFFASRKFNGNPNEKITSEYFSINEFDIILNFWWFHTNNSSGLIGLCKTKKILTYSWFLDAIPLRIPHWQEGFIGESEFRNMVQTHLEISDRVVAISHSAADDASLFFSIPKEKIVIVPCGISEEDFIQSHNPSSISSLYNKFGLKDDVPIFLCIGVQEPSKNTINIIKSCYKVAQYGINNFQLVLIGEHNGFDPKFHFGEVLIKLSKIINVKFTGAISDEEKRILLSQSKLFIYTSLWEGFGIPPLEAMAAGVPVLTSDIASLPEVCQDHAWFCDPYDPSDIAEKISEILLLSDEERSIRIVKAKEYARKWVWDNHAIPLLIADIKNQLFQRPLSENGCLSEE